jgi:oligopeptide transport system ATP-binding protein
MNEVGEVEEMDSLIKVENLKKHYPIRQADSLTRHDWLKAVDDVSFELFEGETLGLVGESGCGKSTIRKMLLYVEPPTAGKVLFRGNDSFKMNKSELKEYRRNVQMVFQDPYSSLNPKWKVDRLISEPLVIHKSGNKKSRLEKVAELMKLVGLREEYSQSFAHEFSGGQRQRICVARALALDPRVIIADEPVSALDVSIQAQVINLFKDLKDKLNLTYLFISHDLSVVKHISDRVAVMYLGKIVEIAKKTDLFDHPLHPYTQALIDSILVPNPEVTMEAVALSGEVPSPINPPAGCAFHPRCPYVVDQCREETPVLRIMENEHQVACHLADAEFRSRKTS